MAGMTTQCIEGGGGGGRERDFGGEQQRLQTLYGHSYC